MAHLTSSINSNSLSGTLTNSNDPKIFSEELLTDIFSLALGNQSATFSQNSKMDSSTVSDLTYETARSEYITNQLGK